MSDTTLLIHPAPHPTENLRAYALRVFSANGYNMTTAYGMIGRLSAGAETDLKIDRSKLARLTRQPPEVLERLAIRVDSTKHSMLGNDLSFADVLPTSARLCLECLRTKGFVETHFQVALMFGCPEHHRKLLENCPNCAKVLRWTRPSLAECGCGFDFSNASTPPLHTEAARLLDVVRRRALHLPLSEETSSKFPTKYLGFLQLRTLLTLIRLLGTHRLLASLADSDDEEAIVGAAASVLSTWPDGLLNLLTDLHFRYRTRTGRSTKGGYERFLEATERLHFSENPARLAFFEDVLDHHNNLEERRRERASDKRVQRQASDARARAFHRWEFFGGPDEDI